MLRWSAQDFCFEIWLNKLWLDVEEKCLKITSNKYHSYWDFLIIKCGTRLGQDWEYHAFTLKTEMRTWWDLNKLSRFLIVCDETRPETSGKINKHMSMRSKLIHNQNWIKTESLSAFSFKTETRLRVLSFTRGTWCQRLEVEGCFK